MSEENKRNYTKKNIVSNLWEKRSKTKLGKLFAKLDTKNITDNKTFSQTAFFSDKTLDSDQITLINNDEIISEDENIAKTFNDFLSNVVKNLKLTVDKSFLNLDFHFLLEPRPYRRSCAESFKTLRKSP